MGSFRSSTRITRTLGGRQGTEGAECHQAGDHGGRCREGRGEVKQLGICLDGRNETHITPGAVREYMHMSAESAWDDDSAQRQVVER